MEYQTCGKETANHQSYPLTVGYLSQTYNIHTVKQLFLIS